MKNELKSVQQQLPDTIPELARFVLVGREKVTAVRAEIRAIEKVGLAREVRAQKLQEAQDIAEAVLDAEVRLGELLAEIPSTQGQRNDLQLRDSGGAKLKSKKEAIEEVGFSKKTAERMEILAAHPDVVEAAKAEARANDDIVSRSAVLHAINQEKRPYIVNNSGETEWFTPSYIVEAARKVMGAIDLDPASCEWANKTVKARKFYDISEDGLQQEWKGTVFLNPPYNETNKFIDRLCAADKVTQAVVICNNCTETKWFKDLVTRASAIVFFTGRLRFVRSTDGISGSAMQGQAAVYIGENVDDFLQEFGQYGWGARL